MLRQTFAEVIVVCYGCEEGTAEWVRSEYPNVKLVEVNDDPQFCVARARNIGASYAQYSLIAFVDADIILAGDIATWIKTIPNEPLYFAPIPGTWEYGGFIVCPIEAFKTIEGYDEAFRGWGHEDTDFIERLEQAGYRRASVPMDLLNVISHGNEERQIGPDSGGFRTVEEALYLGEFYRRIKTDVSNLTGQSIGFEARKNLMAAIKRGFEVACQSHKKELTLTCTVNASTFGRNAVQAENDLVYHLKIDHILNATHSHES